MPRPRGCSIGAINLLLVWLFCASPQASSPVHRDEGAIAANPQLELTDVLQGVISQHPDSARLHAKQATAETWLARSRGLNGLLADTPTLSMRYQTDRWNDDAGLTEYEGGILLPLWTPRQRQRSRAVGEALSGEAQAAARRLHWEAAGTARELLWQLAAAEAALDNRLEAATVRDQAVAAMRSRVAAGDAAKKDLLLTEADRLAGERRIIEARAALADAGRRYQALSGLQQRPAFRAERVSTRTSLDEEHPMISWALSRVRSARSELAAARQNARGNPSVLIGPRRERGADTNRYDESFGVTVTIPLSSARLGRWKTAEVAEAVAEAESALSRTRRDLSLSLHEAEHELQVAEDALRAANAELEAAARVLEMGRRAFDAGEMPLAEVLRLQTAWLDAAELCALLDVRRKHTIANYNQTVGETP